MSIPVPAELNLTASAVSGLNQPLQFKSSPSGAALDLRDHSLIAELWDEGYTTFYGQLALEEVDPAAGRFSLALSAASAAALPPQCVWDLLVIEPGGGQRVWLRGSVSVG